MSSKISPLAVIDERAELGRDVEIGPFCVVGPGVRLGDGSRLDSHVTIVGDTTIGSGNRFWPNTVIGAEPQDKSYEASATRVLIGNDNQFREGVTVNRGAEKEDGVTCIGHRNLLMANSHVAHNCLIDNDTILVNGVLLGGHVHVQDYAIVSGNTVVHHYSTIGTLAFVSGGCRVPHDIPPYMMAAGSDNPTIRTVNLVGLRRRGVSEPAIRVLKEAHRQLFRQKKPLDEVRSGFFKSLGGSLPIELTNLLNFLDLQRGGEMGRAREVFRKPAPENHEPAQTPQTPNTRRRAA